MVSKMQAIAMIGCAFLQVATASTCADGVCTEHDETSLMQVNKMISKGDDAHGRKVVPASKVKTSVHEHAAEKPLERYVSDVLHEMRAAADADDDAYNDWHATRSVVPPPVGHGHVDPNPHVVGWKAEAETMPGAPGGPVQEAFDNSKRAAEDALMGAEDRTLEQEKRAIAFNRGLENAAAKQDDEYEAALQHDQVDITATLAGKRKVEQESLDEVAQAQKDYEKAAIVQDQTETAALEGQAMGETSGIEKAAEARQKAENDMEKRELMREREDMKEAVRKARAEGLTAEQRAMQERELEGRNYLKSREKEMKAGEAAAAASKADIENYIVGPEAIEEKQIKEAADSQAKQLEHMAASAREA